MRSLYFIALLFFLFSFRPSILSAQAKLIPDNPIWQMGTIQEAKGKVYHIYTCTNKGDKPLVINEVISSCGCAVAEYPKYPINPQEKAEIKVSFDPNGRTSMVSKTLRVVYNGGKNVCNLFIKGLIEIQINPTKDFQYDYAHEMRIDRLFLYGGTLANNEQKVLVLNIYNSSKQTQKISYYTSCNSEGMIFKMPKHIKSKSAEKIYITLNTGNLKKGKITNYLYLIINGKASKKAVQIVANINK